MSKITKRKLKILDMHCSSCAMRIDFDLEELKGVKSAKTNYAKSETEVEFDEELIGLNKILHTIQKTGYKAQDK